MCGLTLSTHDESWVYGDGVFSGLDVLHQMESRTPLVSEQLRCSAHSVLYQHRPERVLGTDKGGNLSHIVITLIPSIQPPTFYSQGTSDPFGEMDPQGVVFRFNFPGAFCESRFGQQG